MLTQKGASDALHAMAPGSSKHDLSSRQEDRDAEFTQRVIAAQDEEAQQPNQFADDEERHVDAAVQERGNPVHALVCLNLRELGSAMRNDHPQDEPRPCWTVGVACADRNRTTCRGLCWEGMCPA